MTESIASNAAAIADAERRINAGVQQIIARATPAERAEPTRPGGLDFGWSGGGQPIDITAVDPMLLEVPFDARIVWAHLYALDGAGNPAPVTATVELRIRQATARGGTTALYGTGSVPALSSAGFAELDTTGWLTNLTIGDAVIARLTALTGVANVVVLAIQLRPTEAPLGIAGVVDSGGDAFVDASGNRFVFRS
jgi:hypothetical protein